MNNACTTGENPMRKRFQSMLIISTCFLGVALSVRADGAPARAADKAPAHAAAPATNTPVVAKSTATAVVEAEQPVAPSATLTGKVEAASVTNKPADLAPDSIVIDYNEADMQRVLRT